MVKYLDIADSPKDVGFFVGLIFTAFLIAQSVTSPLWGRLSDWIGRRKPFVLSGAFGTMIGFLLFGLSETYAMVLLNLLSELNVGNGSLGLSWTFEQQYRDYQRYRWGAD
jgi:MFS family permease